MPTTPEPAEWRKSVELETLRSLFSDIYNFKKIIYSRRVKL